MTKEERNRKLREHRITLVVTWVICFVIGMMTGLFLAKITEQRPRQTVESAPECMESNTEVLPVGEVKLHTREWWKGIGVRWKAQEEPAIEVVVFTEPETEEPEMATPEPTVEPTPTPTPEPNWIKVLATAYRDSKNQVPTGCVNDLPLTEYWSIAAVLSDLPYGTLVEIEGFGIRRVEDTASQGVINARLRQAWDRGCSTWIDIFIPDAAEVDAFGIRELRLRVIE